MQQARCNDYIGAKYAVKLKQGLLKGLALNADWQTCAQLGSVAATYSLECVGGQSHKFSLAEFRERYEQHFGASPV